MGVGAGELDENIEENISEIWMKVRTKWCVDPEFAQALLRVTAFGIDYIDEALKGYAHTLCLPRGWSMSPIALLNWSRFGTLVRRRMHRIRAVPCRCIACDGTCPQLNKREPFRGGKLIRRPPSLYSADSSTQCFAHLSTLNQ